MNRPTLMHEEPILYVSSNTNINFAADQNLNYYNCHT